MWCGMLCVVGLFVVVFDLLFEFVMCFLYVYLGVDIMLFVYSVFIVVDKVVFG